MTLLVVRHAHAGIRERWPYDDHERPLSEQGRAQAQKLPVQLAEHPIERILTSPSRRCVDTVKALACDRGLELELRAELIENSPLAAVWQLIDEVGDQHAVLCSHGDIIQALVRDLVARQVPMPSDPGWEKGSTWVLELSPDHEVTSARYLAPPE